MSRSGYIEDFDDPWATICWRGAVKSAIRGKRGQAFLKEMLVALDALPEKKLVSGALVTPQGEVCALGSVIVKRNIDLPPLEDFDEDFDYEWLADNLNISEALTREIMYVNDEEAHPKWDAPRGESMTDERRFEYVHNWVEQHIQKEQAPQ